MHVEQIMQCPVRCCRKNDSGQTAASMMRETDCGALPVVDENETLLGIVTDRDLLIAANQGRCSLLEVSVVQAMSPGTFVCRPDDDVQVVERLMCRHQVRRIPVVDADGTIVGIVSLSDLAREQAAAPTGDPDPDRQVVAATLEAIVQPSPESRVMDGAHR